MTVSRSGKGRLGGVLGDGTPITANVPISAFDTFPLYNAIYSKKLGSCIGLLTLATNAASTNATLDGAVDWIKPAAAKDHFYPAGFATTVTLTGATFAKPSKGGPTVAGNAQVILGGGNTPSNIVKSVVISSNGVVTVSSPDTDQLALFIAPGSGQFLGNFFDTASHRRITFNGLLVQTNSSISGGGFFRGTNQTGFVIITP